LQKLEAIAAPPAFTGFLRIVQDEDLTPEQGQQIAEAQAAGKLVIIREIVSPDDPASKLHGP
jgi:hypothetical protein